MAIELRPQICDVTSPYVQFNVASYVVLQAVSRSARIAVGKTDMTLRARRWNASVRPTPDSDDDYLGRRLADWYPRDETTLSPVTSVRRRSLSPTRKLALEHLAAQENHGSRKYRAMKSLESIVKRAGGESVVREARSVLDIDRLRRRADKRRDEVALHLVSHDPDSAVFRAALTDSRPSYHLAPRPHSVPDVPVSVADPGR